MILICDNCEKEFYRPSKTINRNNKTKTKNIFCSNVCHNLFRRRTLVCESCGKEFSRRSHQVNKNHNYCSRKCSNTERNRLFYGEKHPNYTNGEGSYRRLALRLYENKCNKCEYDKNIDMLDVDHIDGDRSNNDPANLQILCVWCHAIKTREVEWHCWL